MDVMCQQYHEEDFLACIWDGMEYLGYSFIHKSVRTKEGKEHKLLYFFTNRNASYSLPSNGGDSRIEDGSSTYSG